MIDFDLKYEFGDLSIELDKRVKNSVAQFCGKDTYSPGDLSRELAKRTSEGVLKYTGNDSYKVRSCVLSVFPIHMLCCGLKIYCTSHLISSISLETLPSKRLRTTLEMMNINSGM